MFSILGVRAHNSLMVRKLFLTPGGSELWIALGDIVTPQGKDGHCVPAVINHVSGTKDIRVCFDRLVRLDSVSEERNPEAETDGDAWEVLAVLAIIDYVDSDPESLEDNHKAVLLVDHDLAFRIINRSSMSDRDLRRFIARWVYTVYSHQTLSVRIAFSRIDELITGCSALAIERNVGVLVAEQYLTYGEVKRNGTVSPTVKLVREVERYGAAKEDAVAEHDYSASLRAYPILAGHRDGIVMEWERYSTARTATELVSVFRALVPYVEAILGDVLHSHGSKKAAATLAPMITDLQRRQLADRGLLSKLNHIIVFARDLALHGASTPEPVLRIACENAFGLIPQIAALTKA